MRTIHDNLYYLGVNDPTTDLFEGLWPLPYGVAYNSYLLTDDKTVLFDTVEDSFSGVFFDRLERTLAGRQLDYLVVNHMEPDHSGSIAILRKRYPQVQIVGNARTADMLKGYYGIEEGVMVIKDGDELSLGNHTLRFYLTPMVHWPETMMTYETSTQTLFAGDAFGCFGTLDGGFTDTQLNLDKYWDEMYRYYSNIVGKYGSPVQKALAKLGQLPLNTICSTHGPVWTEQCHILRVIGIYDALSKYNAEPGVVIAYGSMYGHTAAMAERIAQELSTAGVKHIVLHDVSRTDASYILRDVFKYQALIVGSPTYNAKLYPRVEALLSQIKARDIKNRYFSYFGSYSWAGAAVKLLGEFAETSGFEVVGEPIEMRQAMFESVDEQIQTLAQAVAAKLK